MWKFEYVMCLVPMSFWVRRVALLQIQRPGETKERIYGSCKKRDVGTYQKRWQGRNEGQGFHKGVNLWELEKKRCRYLSEEMG